MQKPYGWTSSALQMEQTALSIGFQVSARCAHTNARAGLLQTSHGAVATPVFMPVGTQGSVKSLCPADLTALGAQAILGNAYHLYLRPGSTLIAAHGGLHQFISWPGMILTDSGGFQVFSLGELRQITEDGVAFRSHLDGEEHLFTPERVMAIEEDLGSDIAMAFDECPPITSDRPYQVEAMGRTHRWAERCLQAKRRLDQALFGIVQGGSYADLREESARFLVSLDLPGYAIGGLSLGEPKEVTWAMVEASLAVLPAEKPRYLMGVGTPEDLVEAVSLGIDMLDSVMPTRVARNGALFTRGGRKNIRNAHFRTLDAPVEADCDCYTCRTFSAAYLHHLFRGEELLAYRLATIHNLRFMVRLTEQIRQAIVNGEWPALKAQLQVGYREKASVGYV